MLKPHSLGKPELTDDIPRAKRLEIMGWAGRHGGYWPKGTVLPETRVGACPRVRVMDLPDNHLKKNHIEQLEQNQKIASCCRHPENHDVEAFKSHPDEPLPDIYIFYCTCGRKHRFFCVGKTDVRPVWKAS